MSGGLEPIFERLVAAEINILPGPAPGWVLFNRGEYVALVERTEAGLGRRGMGGLLTSAGFAALTWVGESAYFAAKGGQRFAASADEIASLRTFQADLEKAITG